MSNSFAVGERNSTARIAQVTTGLESIALLIPNETIKKIMVVLSPGIAFFLVIGIRHLYKLYECRTTIVLFTKYLREAEEELKSHDITISRRKELETDVVSYKNDIKLLEKNMIKIEFK